MSNRLIVYFKNKIVGDLKITKVPDFNFTYSEKYLNQKDALAISFSLPLQPEPFGEKKSMAFFENLLPEQTIRVELSHSLKISQNNIFGLLSEVGGECSGALSIMPEESDPQKKWVYKKLTYKKLESILKSAVKAPFQANNTEVRMSLAGAQNKYPIYFKNGNFYQTIENSPSSHIIKHPHSEFPHTIINELYCMRFARLLGLNVPNCFRIHLSAKYQVFLIERYDRITTTGGDLDRLHQEDFCQIFGLDSALKYETAGHSHGINEVFDFIMANSSRVIPDRQQLVKWLLFNFLIGNRDNHLKNLSILYTGGKTMLTPFYDLICTTVYPQLSPKLAIKVDSKNDEKFIKYKNWVNFFEKVGIKEPFFKSVIADFKAKVSGNKKLIEEITDNSGEAAFLNKIFSRFFRRFKTLDKTA